MACSACAAFGGRCNARTSWSPYALLCVRLGLVSAVCGAALCPVAPPDVVLFFILLAHSPLLVCAAGGGGGGVTPCLPLWPSHCDLGGITGGTGHFCTCLQICKLT